MPEVKTLTVSGRPAAYLETGRGRPVVLVHGAGGRGALWNPQLTGLSDIARVIAPDLPGHGGTGGRGSVRVAEYAEWLIRFLDAAGLDRVVLGGHSMGGAIAQTVAVAHGDRLQGLILVGTGARLRVLPRIVELLREALPDGLRLISSLAYSPRTEPGAVAAVERALRETPPLVTLGDYLACDRFDVMAQLTHVRAPTLVIVGRDDRLTPAKYAAFLASTIAGAQLVEVAAAGHYPQLEQPAALNAAVRAFLESVPTHD